MKHGYISTQLQVNKPTKFGLGMRRIGLKLHELHKTVKNACFVFFFLLAFVSAKEGLKALEIVCCNSLETVQMRLGS